MMKKLSVSTAFWTISALLLVFSACKNREQNSRKEQVRAENAKAYVFDKSKPYPFESGRLEYKYTGDIQGSQIVYIDNYGKRFRVEDQDSNLITHQKQNRLFIQDRDKYYDIDLLTRKGYYLLRNDSTSQFEGNLLSDIIGAGVDSTMHKNGYSLNGDTLISEKKCQLYRSKDGKSEFCFWQGVNIKTDMAYGTGLKYRLEAVKIEEGVKLDDQLFVPPKDVTITDYKTYIRQMREKL